jgi:hypothetical protein
VGERPGEQDKPHHPVSLVVGGWVGSGRGLQGSHHPVSLVMGGWVCGEWERGLGSKINPFLFSSPRIRGIKGTWWVGGKGLGTRLKNYFKSTPRGG